MMEIPYGNEDGAYVLTPLAAEGLSRPAELRAKLNEAFGEEGDLHMMFMRFIQGRELRELDPPTETDMEVLLRDYATVTVLATLYELTLKGMVYVDVIDEGNGPEVAFSITADGRAAIEKDGRLY